MLWEVHIVPNSKNLILSKLLNAIKSLDDKDLETILLVASAFSAGKAAAEQKAS